MLLRRGGRSVAVLLALAVSTAQAQDGRQIDFGVFAGGTFSKFGGADAGNFDKIKVGLAAGGFITLGLSPYFALQPELHFARKGGQEEGSNDQFAISYIQVPVLAKLRIPPKGNGSQFSPHVYGGGAVGFKTGCSFKSGSTVAKCDAVGADVKTIDMSLVFGAGVDIGRAMIGGRFDLGLRTFDASATPEDVKNRTFYLLVGWTFRAPR